MDRYRAFLDDTCHNVGCTRVQFDDDFGGLVVIQDPSGRMKGYFHPDCLEEYGPDLGPGAAVLLKEASARRIT